MSSSRMVAVICVLCGCTGQIGSESSETSLESSGSDTDSVLDAAGNRSGASTGAAGAGSGSGGVGGETDGVALPSGGAAAGAGADLTVTPSGTPSNVPLGMNLGAVTYYCNALPFVDLMRNAEPFMSANPPGQPGPWNTNVAHLIPRDADGYPLQIPFTVGGQSAPQVLRVATGRMIYAGDYVLLYDGDGDFSFLASGSSVVSRAPGRIVLRVPAPSAETIFITITRSNAGNHVRNMRFVLPGFEQSYATMIEMANALGADGWFNVPHLADDDYVTQMATLIKNRLGSGQRVYIEYSNELWNGIFRARARRTGRELQPQRLAAASVSRRRGQPARSARARRRTRPSPTSTVCD